MHGPRFSVVIPLYNKVRHIRNSIDSVLAQTFSDFEIVVVDDGSRDGSGDVVATIEEPRLRLVTQDNAGVSAARNRGAGEARGEYLAFLDADDLWKPCHLEELERLIRAFPDSGIYSVAHEIVQGSLVYRPNTGVGSEFFGRVDNFLSAFSGGLALVNSSTACIRKDVFSASGGFPLGVTRGEDLYLWIRIGLESGVAYSARVCAQVNRDAENRSNTSTNPEIQYHLKYLDGLISEKRLQGDALAGAIEMFRRSAILSAAGFKLEGNQAAFAGIRALRGCKKDARIYVALLLLALTPTFVLKVLKRFRHKRVR